ncbi:hypothetical protein WKW80_24600 [Variovorax humicola]|uniref:Uncharacterized protein n=1 Tax=Variovorax humicola TaxID=1769758 RepID=A0ABU8W6E0_9BURK
MPDLFRQNTNQFLQTSRTVTFIIQKNKAAISGFDVWYRSNVLTPWASDPVMTWAKDSRNVIEKEGDLDMHSSLRATVLFSYLDAEDMVVETARAELLKADLARLLRFARSKLTPALADAAVLKIERRWIANSLPKWELLHALTYTYARLHEACSALALHIGDELDTTVRHPTDFDPVAHDAGRARFLRFEKEGIGRSKGIRVERDRNYQPPPEIVRLKAELDSTPKPASLADLVAKHARMAKVTFELHGNHVPMLALYDKEWNQIDMMSTAFTDQAEKYLFWRNVAARAAYLKAYAMVWTCESWLRDLKAHNDERPIRKLPIIGEQLNVVGADATEASQIVAWNIVREQDEASPTLELVQPDDEKNHPGKMFFIMPVVEAMKSVHSSGAK